MEEKPPLNHNVRKASKRLNALLSEYEHFDSWQLSDSCPLSKTEYNAIKSYQKHKTHEEYAFRTNKTKENVAAFYKRAILKLEQTRTKMRYRKWRDFTELARLGLADGKKEPNYDSFLQPLAEWLVPMEKVAELIDPKATVPFGGPYTIYPLDHFEMQAIRKRYYCLHIYIETEV